MLFVMSCPLSVMKLYSKPISEIVKKKWAYVLMCTGMEMKTEQGLRKKQSDKENVRKMARNSLEKSGKLLAKL